MMHGGDAVAIRGVTKYFGEYAAVDDLTLTVPRGSVYGFIGPNGSGKTTTLRMTMNILFPDAGEIAVLGERTTAAARDRVSYLPEERGLYKKMTVREVLRYYGRLKLVPRARLDGAIDAWLERMQLADRAGLKVESLSKGQAQKVQFISAVVSEPELLILDEPFSGLDPVNAESLKDAVLELRDRGTTIVFSTHDMATAERLCDRIFMIFRGKKVLDGTLAEIQEQYGADTIRVRTDGGRDALDGMPGIDKIVDHGNLQEVRVTGDPQAFLRALVARTRVQQFEVTRPSLHDIFVRIAQPEPTS
ncbi:MAG: ATP-binding cassette domain-containing protein [Myxococcales bacterium]|nr:ATP-binding cassette domain-containing protein [Myxococcales bacterium]